VSGEGEGGDTINEDGRTVRGGETGGEGVDGEDEDADDHKPLSGILIRDLTAHRTLGLRLSLNEQSEVAIIAVTMQTYSRARQTTRSSGRADRPTAAARSERGAAALPKLWAFQKSRFAFAMRSAGPCDNHLEEDCCHRPGVLSMAQLFIKLVAMLLIFLVTALLGYPMAAFAEHGFDIDTWPSSVTLPAKWMTFITSGNGAEIWSAYWAMFRNQSEAFAGGGRIIFGALMAPFAVSAMLIFAGKSFGPKRDPQNLHGSARWATATEIRKMASGFELGIDPRTGRAVRVSIEGNLLTIAPPRKGKTSGVLLPNLAFPEKGSWGGPAVVMDPKGEVFRAAADRRGKMGRTVRCLDPLDLVGGTDRWNPFDTLDATDILYMQHTALVLLPQAVGESDSAAYFRSRATDLIVGAMLVALKSPTKNMTEIWRLLNDEAALIAGLKQIASEPAAAAALTIMNDDPKTRDPIRSTAAQAFSWLADPRLRHLVGDSSFKLADLSRGDTDLFIAVPTRDSTMLAPFLRWLLADIFNTIRSNRPAERIMIFIDEAATLGNFESILKASGELPGFGGSLWTIWQDRRQIVQLYGEAGAAILLGTTEIVTLFDVSAVDPDESDRWSRALGDFSVLVDSVSTGAGSQKSSTSTSSRGTRLLNKEELTTALANNDLIVFPNSMYYTRHPLRLRKTVAFTDRRFAKLLVHVPPVGRA
jgi:type IV secretion system protein VirD4